MAAENEQDIQTVVRGQDEGRFVADFGAGGLGTGPQTGFAADDFFPVLSPAADPNPAEPSEST